LTKPRIAIVLFNLGGPDRPESIRPFLLKLFSDPAILRVNRLLRPFVARAITRARLGPAMANYARIGGRSGLLEMTERQGRALEAELPELEARCFVAMRYWHPTSGGGRAAVQAG
jgi:ferrochelatase